MFRESMSYRLHPHIRSIHAGGLRGGKYEKVHERGDACVQTRVHPPRLTRHLETETTCLKILQSVRATYAPIKLGRCARNNHTTPNSPSPCPLGTLQMRRTPSNEKHPFRRVDSIGRFAYVVLDQSIQHVEVGMSENE